MKKKSFFKSIVIAAAVCLAAGSCGMGGPSAPVADDYIANQEALSAQIDKLLDKAGTSTDKVELADIALWSTITSSGDRSNYMSLKMVDPSDKDKMKEFTWMDTDGRRNYYDAQDLIVTQGLIDRDVVEGYDSYKEMLFTYADLKPYIDNMAALCAEATEASGYKDKAFVKSFSYDKDSGARLEVAHKDNSSVSKRYNITPDGKHIVKD